jgi:hypothetical protein
LTGDLAGNYLPLDKMSEQDKQNLIAENLLFKEGDRYLKSAGINRDWPNGRGIFINNEKTFMVWVNE